MITTTNLAEITTIVVGITIGGGRIIIVVVEEEATTMAIIATITTIRIVRQLEFKGGNNPSGLSSFTAFCDSVGLYNSVCATNRSTSLS